MSTKLSFQLAANEDRFGQELNQRVKDYFDSGRSMKADWTIWLKSAFYLTAYIGAYCLLISNQFSLGETYVLWASIGLLVPLIGFNIGHDAIHGAYSEKTWVNKLFGESFSMIGADTRIWKILHNIIHHSYTNIWNADGDLKPVPALRFHPNSEYRPWHAFQHFYAPILYCFTSLVWVFRKDYQFLLKDQHLLYKIPTAKKSEVAKVLIVKAVYYTAFIVLPLLLLSQAWWQILLGFCLMHAVAGFFLAMVFQLGHIVEGPTFYDLPDHGVLEGSWASLQLQGSSNFSMHAVGLWLFGGLNYQIEHHLYPRVSHKHYPAISKIVREVAAKNNLSYNAHPSFLGAVYSHFKVLRTLSRPNATNVALNERVA